MRTTTMYRTFFLGGVDEVFCARFGCWDPALCAPGGNLTHALQAYGSKMVGAAPLTSALFIQQQPPSEVAWQWGDAGPTKV
jgi:hypothetical protein